MSSVRFAIAHIAAGTDYSDSSRGAVGEALRLGARFGATVSVVNITTDGAASGDTTSMDKFLAGESIADNVTVRREIVASKNIAQALGEYAERESVDLLVVGPRARTFVERHIKGGIAEQLFSQTRVATLATPSVANEYRKIVVAIDQSDASAKALAVAAALLRRDLPDAQLIALHVLSGRGAGAIAGVEEGQALERAMITDAKERLGRFVRKQVGDLPPSMWRVEATIGAIGHRMPQFVASEAPDLVCMGSVGRKGIVGLLAGNAADRMVRTLDRPLLVAHP